MGLPRTRVNKGKWKGQGPFSGIPALRDGSDDALRLTQEVFCGALLLLERTFILIRPSFRLFVLVSGQGTRGFLGAALGLVHRPFVLVFAAVSGHSRAFL